MRRVSGFGILAFANFATCGLGQSFMGEQGKLSISNLGPLAFILFAAPCFLADVKTIRKQTVAFFLLFNACALVSFALFMFRFGWTPNVPVLGFQDVEIIFMLLLVNKSDLMGNFKNPKVYNAIAWILTVIVIVLTVAMLLLQ